MQTLYFAAYDDLFPVLHEIERKHDIQYVLRDSMKTTNYPCYETYEAIPDIGIAKADSTVAGQYYFIIPKISRIISKPVRYNDGGTIDTFDQLDNAESVYFAPGGAWENRAVISGSISTIQMDGFSKKIYATLKKVIKDKLNTRAGVYYIGSNAKQLYLEGKRLTAAIKSPMRFDITIPGHPKISGDGPELVRPNYKEGDVYGIPLKNNKWGICIIVREKIATLENAILGYFYLIRENEVPTIRQAEMLKPKDADIISRSNPEPIMYGEWIYIGTIKITDKSKWPYPDMFIEPDEYGMKSNERGIIIRGSNSILCELNGKIN
jgi:hypothetical protein